MDIVFYFLFSICIFYMLSKWFFKKIFKEAFIEALNENNAALKLLIKECLRDHDFSKRNKE